MSVGPKLSILYLVLQHRWRVHTLPGAGFYVFHLSWKYYHKYTTSLKLTTYINVGLCVHTRQKKQALQLRQRNVYTFTYVGRFQPG